MHFTSCCDLAYVVAKYAMSHHMDHVPNVQNHFTFRTHFNGSILSSLLSYTLGTVYLYLGSCLSYDQLIMERKYTLDLNGTWTVFQECKNSRIQFDTRCGSSGNWTTDMRCPAMSKKE